MKNLSKKVISLVLICVLIVGVSAPKKAYAVAIADDAVVIICCLLAAAGITFTTSEGVTDAVSDFLEQSGGKFDSLLSQLASNRVVRNGLDLILLPQELAAQVRGLLRGLYDYFTVGDDRTGSVTVSVAGGKWEIFDLQSDAVMDGFAITSLESSSPVYVLPFIYLMSGPEFLPSVIVFSLKPFSFDFVQPVSGKSLSLRSKSRSLYSSFPDNELNVFYSRFDFGFSAFSSRSEVVFPVFGLSPFDVPMNSTNPPIAGTAGVTSSGFSVDGIQPYVHGFLSGTLSSDSVLDYGLTFPEELTYEDVLDRFEERLEAAAGDLAIALPQSGVVDNTLTYQEAQEQVLVNVNELGEVTDTTTETNTWLQKLLVAVKAIPATLIGLLEDLLIKLFCPTDTVLQGGFDGIMAAFKEKTDYQTYIDLLSRFQGLSEPDLDDITINWYGNTYTVITWDFFRRTKAIYSRYLRGFLYLFLLLFNFNNVYKLIRNSSFFDGSGMNQRNQNRKGE